jgi:hypothetical protein
MKSLLQRFSEFVCRATPSAERANQRKTSSTRTHAKPVRGISVESLEERLLMFHDAGGIGVHLPCVGGYEYNQYAGQWVCMEEGDYRDAIWYPPNMGGWPGSVGWPGPFNSINSGNGLPTSPFSPGGGFAGSGIGFDPFTAPFGVGFVQRDSGAGMPVSSLGLGGGYGGGFTGYGGGGIFGMPNLFGLGGFTGLGGVTDTGCRYSDPLGLCSGSYVNYVPDYSNLPPSNWGGLNSYGRSMFGVPSNAQDTNNPFLNQPNGFGGGMTNTNVEMIDPFRFAMYAQSWLGGNTEACPLSFNPGECSPYGWPELPQLPPDLPLPEFPCNAVPLVGDWYYAGPYCPPELPEVEIPGQGVVPGEGNYCILIYPSPCEPTDESPPAGEGWDKLNPSDIRCTAIVPECMPEWPRHSVGLGLWNDSGDSATDLITNDGWVTLTGPTYGIVPIVRVTVDGQDVTPAGFGMADGPGAIQVTGDGAHHVELTYRDWFGERTATLDFILDTIAPEPILRLVHDTGISATDRVTRDGRTSISNSEGSLSVTLDGNAAALDNLGQVTATRVGPHQVSAIASDLAGNAGTATLDFVLESSAPRVESVRMVRTSRGVSEVVVTFSDRLDVATASRLGGYKVTLPGRKPKSVVVSAVSFDGDRTVTLRLQKPAKATANLDVAFVGSTLAGPADNRAG